MNIREIHQAPEPQKLFEVLRSRPGCFFLDSAMTGTLGRYSFLGCEPYRVIRQYDIYMNDFHHGRHHIHRVNPFTALKDLLPKPKVRTDAPELPTPFASGAVGYLGYGLNRFVERLPRTARRDGGLPDMYLAFYDVVATYDHLANECWVTAFRPGASKRHNRAASERMRRHIDEAAKLETVEDDESELGCIKPGSLKSNFTRDDYLHAVARTIDYIRAGDIFQANISQRFEARATLPAHAIYRRLRRANPAPFAAFIDLGDNCAVLSSSPEQFLKVTGRRVQTRPIKGTRPRTGDEVHDERMRTELLESAKDNAELAMIVDLERNDLGRVCSYDSIDVTDSCTLETYASVYHLVATVMGELHPDKDLADLLRATFPGGSITGAPKVRAMEIIDELEPTARSVYTGAIGYFDDLGRTDLNIAIRTMLLEGERLTFQVGGGIVADSVPELEYQETLDKARALMRALGVTKYEYETQPMRGQP